MHAITLLKPASVAEAIELYRAHEAARYLAGGTDLVPNWRRELLQEKVLIDISRVAELHEVRAEGGRLHIGAGVTLETLVSSPQVRDNAPVLAQAAEKVAGATHRAAATVGGNLLQDTRCYFYNQSAWWRAANGYCMKRGGEICRVAPKSTRCYACYGGDLAPALLVLDAQAHIVGPAGARHAPLTTLFADDGMRHLILAAGEMLLGVDMPSRPGWVASYAKMRGRGSLDFALVGVAGALRVERGAIVELRLALTGVNSFPGLVSGVSGVLGSVPDERFYTALSKTVANEIQPMATTLTGAGYRRRVGVALARNVVKRLYGMATESTELAARGHIVS